MVQTVAQRHDASIAQVSLAWVLAQPGVTSATVGARRVHQLADNLGAVDLTLTEQDLSELDEISRPALPAYPKWVQSGFYRTSRYPKQ